MDITFNSILSAVEAAEKEEFSVKKRVWLEEGRKRFTHRGLDGINIDEMSQSLDIARTSFYHFFSTKENFVNRLIKYWDQKTMWPIEQLTEHAKDFDEFFENFLEIIINNYESDMFFAHLRALATDHKAFAKHVKQVDQYRINIVKEILLGLGNSSENIADKAKIFYFTYLGFVEYFKLTGLTPALMRMMKTHMRSIAYPQTVNPYSSDA